MDQPTKEQHSSKATRRTDAATYKVTAYPYVQTGKLLAALASQRGREKETELYRQATDIGSLFVAIAGEPGPDGQYGTLSADALAERIRPYVVGAVDWLARNGHSLHAAPGHGLLADGLLALLQQGSVQRALPEPEPASPERVLAPPDLTEVPELYLSDNLETALSLEDGGGFL